MYILARHNSSILGLSGSRRGMSNILREEKSRHESAYNSNIPYYQNYYGSVDNYIGQMMNSHKVYRIIGDTLNIAAGVFIYDNTTRSHVIKPEFHATDLTDVFLRVEDTTREGNLKVFATVVKTGLKSTGMEVILDPQLVGSRVHPVSYYENLVGTFSRIKATTLVNEDYGYATLFFSPEALGNIRIETQQLSAKVVTLL